MFQNTGMSTVKNSATSKFVDPTTGQTLVYTAKSSTVRPSKDTSVDIANITVALNQPQPVGTPECDPCGNGKVQTSATIRLNIVKGDEANLNSMLAAATSALEQSVTTYQMAHGLVPPASAVISLEP